MTGTMFSTTEAQEIPCKLQDYTVLEFLGEGVFGKVAKCFNSKTGKVVALKILKDCQDDLEREVKILQQLNIIQPDNANIVKLIDFFTCDNFKCMAFEMLDCSLLDLGHQQDRPFSLCEIRPITQQLLVAFEALRKADVIHADLKLDNIMLVNHKTKPFKVRLIDFGCGGYKSELEVGMMMQAGAYRAPEVTLGVPLSEAVDMWSLGCCLGECFLGCSLFSGSSSYDSLRTIMHLLEEPSDEMLNKGIYTDRYFIQTGGSRQWRFKSPLAYEITTGKKPDICSYPFEKVSGLDEVIESYAAKVQGDENSDLLSFLSLLKQLLHIDPDKRITPKEALQHPFITMDHLTNSQYAERARTMMALSLKDSSPAPLQDIMADPGMNRPHSDIPQDSAAAPERNVSYWTCQDQDDGLQSHKPHLREISPKPIPEGISCSSGDFRYIDIDEYSFLCINTESKCDEEDMFVTSTGRSDVSECITHFQTDLIQPCVTDHHNNTEDLVQSQDQQESCYVEMDPNVNTEPSLNEEGAVKPEFVAIEMGDCSDNGSQSSCTAGSRSCSSWSVWSACKTLAFSGLVAVQTTACYMLTGSPVVAGIVALPMVLYGCVDMLATVISPSPERSTSGGS